MSKPGPLFAKPLAAILGKTIDEVFARQGFATRELITRWTEIAGAEIAAHSQPIKVQWPRPVGDAPAEPATLVLRVEGPMALEIQHQSGVILERVNRFLGWQAIGRLALRQAPLTRPERRVPPPAPDAAKVAKIAETLDAVEDPALKDALARLGASVGPRAKPIK
ncbi:DciA family protein [Bradyrhizobium sp. LHD-71]|uniref:DUF721 domain-containing protein n=1 Tax=Bradyrhizobium sp. LHD-71 TaxID=3072141 RepID=UPI00280EE313|nr:DciA family protein [Bradyrhizobium sp. LHD-71]MDQ8730738.1 DciA family protein [Bradyrhizobium sp. LHD-71]